MLKKIKSLLQRFFNKPKPTLIDSNRTKSSVSIGDKVGNVTIFTQSQLDKHTAFKPGESYRIGEGIVTVHANKESMLAAIAAVNAKREAKHKVLTERGIELMLMSPEELQKLKINEWLGKRKNNQSKIDSIISRVTSSVHLPHWGNRLPSGPTGLPPSGKHEDIVSDKFKELTKEVVEVTTEVVEKEKVKV